MGLRTSVAGDGRGRSVEEAVRPSGCPPKMLSKMSADSSSGVSLCNLSLWYRRVSPESKRTLVVLPSPASSCTVPGPRLGCRTRAPTASRAPGQG